MEPPKTAEKALNSRIAANVRRVISDRQITRVTLAEQTGIPYATLKSKVSGKRPLSSTDVIALSEALDVDPGVILGTAVAS